MFRPTIFYIYLVSTARILHDIFWKKKTFPELCEANARVPPPTSTPVISTLFNIGTTLDLSDIAPAAPCMEDKETERETTIIRHTETKLQTKRMLPACFVYTRCPKNQKPFRHYLHNHENSKGKIFTAEPLTPIRILSSFRLWISSWYDPQLVTVTWMKQQGGQFFWDTLNINSSKLCAKILIVQHEQHTVMKWSV